MVAILLIESPDHNEHHPPVEYEHERQFPYREIPDRVNGIRDHLLATGLVAAASAPAAAPVAAIESIHSPDYLAALETLAEMAASAGHYLYPYIYPIRPEMHPPPDTALALLGQYAFDIGSPVGPATWRAALSAAATAHAAAQALLATPTCLPYALCRPPGHHAGHDFMGGYCYLNNAALAACVLKSLGRVAIVDIDYHHGNGTQNIFWDDPQVFFLSLHGDPRFEYPHYAGHPHETGGPAAPGTNLNLPLERGTTGAAYLTALQHGLEALERFNPAALVISLGFDAYRHDPWSAFSLEIEDYAQIAFLLRQLGQPTLLVQEGGYSSAALPRLAEAFLRGWQK